MNTRENAQGKWGEILPALGIPRKCLDGKHHPCPIPGCGGKDRFRFSDTTGNGDFICSQCGAGHGFKLLQRFHGWEWRQAYQEVSKIIGGLPKAKARRMQSRMTREDVSQLWKSARRIQASDPVDCYMIGRGITLATWPKALRLVAQMWHAPSRRYLPCMLANFRSADDEHGTIHRTYIGGNAEPRRMFVPFGVPKGGAIRLFDADICMGVAEGIETALAASLLFKMPVWACANEGLLRAWQPPEGCTHVTIFGDNDSSFVGQAAAYYLAWRLMRDSYHVKVEIPPSPDWDWNDVIKNEIATERYQLAVPQLRPSDSNSKPTSESVSDTNRAAR